MNRFKRIDRETAIMIASIAGRNVSVDEKDDNFQIVLKTDGIDENMIREIRGAVSGKLGDRLLRTWRTSESIAFIVEYGEPDEIILVPEEMKTPDPKAGDVYCHRLEEVRAVKVGRDTFDRLLRFTGGGYLVTLPGEYCEYNTILGDGTVLKAHEGEWIVREESGRFVKYDPVTFRRHYEPRDAPGDQVTEEFIEERLDELYGTDITSRFRKLSEEYFEFGEACRPMVLRGRATEKEREHIIDELGDVEIVLMHIASLLGTSPGECIRRSFEKIERRRQDPDYMREHPKYADSLCIECGRFRGTCELKHETPKYLTCPDFAKKE